MRLVLDACVGVSALLPEEHSEKSAVLLLDYQNQVHELIAPDTFPVEVAHALTRAERKGFIKSPESVRLLGLLGDLLPQLCDSLPLLTRATEISSATRHGVYDCLYLALSEREGCDLVTSDEKLIKYFPNANIIHIKDL